MKKMLIFGLLVVMLTVVTSGCNFPTTVTRNNDPQAAQTFAAETIEARLTANASNAGQGNDPQPQADTPSPLEPQPPTNTPQPTNTPKPTLTPTQETPCNMAKFIEDVTVPDGKEYAPGATFTKTWRLKNVGTCTWDNDYDLVFDDGEKMGGSNVEDINMGGVAPGSSVDVSVDLTAPGSAGNYKGNWQLRSADGVVFALGESDTPFFVEINVVKPVSFKITGSNVYTCTGDNYVSVQIKNTGTESLESAQNAVKNLGTNAVVNYLPWNTPFTENKNDCAVMNIDDMEPGDTYYTTFNMGSSSAKFEYTIKLCTQETAGGDCAIDTIEVKVP